MLISEAPKPDNTNLIESYSNQSIIVDSLEYTSSILLARSRIQPWAVRQLSDLNEATLAPLNHLDAELILLGTGEHFKMPDPALLAPLYAQHISVECMSTPAACRTYQALAYEGRSVAAALILGEKQ